MFSVIYSVTTYVYMFDLFCVSIEYLRVQGFGHYGGAGGQVGISASEAQPARPNFETKMWTIALLLLTLCAILIANDLNYS